MLRSGRTQGASGIGQPGSHPGPTSPLFYTGVRGFPVKFLHQLPTQLGQLVLTGMTSRLITLF